jgi:hypothetical protein
MGPAQTIDIGVLRDFREAIEEQRGGEVVLRSGSETGRVFFVEGRVAWAAASTFKVPFFAYLVEKTELSKVELKEVFDSCKASGSNFAETIVEWGLLDEETLRRLLLEHLCQCMLEIFTWPDATAMFVPEERPYKGSLTFEPREVLEKVLALDGEGKLPFAGATVDGIMTALSSEAVEEPPEAVEEPPEAVEEPPEAVEEPPEEPALVAPGPEAPGPEAPTTQPPVPEAFVAEEKDDGLAWVSAADDSGPAAKIGWARRRGIASTTEPASAIRETSSSRVWIVGVVLVVAGLAGAAAYVLRARLGLVTTPTGAADAAIAAKVTEPDSSARKPDARVREPDARARKPDAARPAARRPDAGKPGPAPIVVGVAGKGRGSVQVVSWPRRARIYLDGIDTRRLTPFTLRRLPAGVEHVVMVTRPRHRPVHKRFVLAANMEAKLKFGLPRGRSRRREPAPVRLESTPPGAAIYVNRRRLEQVTPAEVMLRSTRSSRVELRLRGHRHWRRSILPIPDVAITYRPTLVQRRQRRRRQRRRRRPR